MAYIDEILADSPWAYWVCDDASGEPQDSSGNARHVTSIQQSGLPCGAAPDYEQPTVLLAEPAGQSIKLNCGWFNLPSLSLENADFALECWLKVATLAEGLELFSQGSLGFTNWLIFTKLNTNGSITFDYWNDTLETSPGLVEVDDYVHLVFRREHAADLSSIWLNGIKVAEGSQGPKSSADATFGFGSLSNLGCSQYVGHLAVYLTALDDTRIVDHYNAGAGDEPPVITCADQTETSITVGITPTAGASNHAIYVSQDPLFTPDSDSLWDDSLGPSPTSFTVETLDEAETYYVIVTATVGSFTLQSSTLECATTSGGGAPAFVSVVYINATTVEFRPEVVAAAIEVYYEWQLASETSWTTIIGSTSLTGANRFVHQASPFTGGTQYRVRVRFRYSGGFSAWAETTWTQPTPATSATIGQFTGPGVGYVVTSPVDLTWMLNAGWTATALEVSQDGASYSVLTTSGLAGGSYTFDPTAQTWDEDALLFFRLAATDGSQTGYIYTAVTVDTDGSIPVTIGKFQPLGFSASEWAGTSIVGVGPVWLVPGSDPYSGGGIAGTNGTNAYLVFPSLSAREGDGFSAFVGGAALASGTTLSWWMNQEISGTFFGLRYVDENGDAVVDFEFLFGTVMPLYPACHPTNLRGNAQYSLRVSGSPVEGGTIITAAGSWFGAPCQILAMPHGLALSLDRISGTDDYAYVATIVGETSATTISGTLSVPGGLPCGYCVPYLGRISSPGFTGYPLLTGFWWSPSGIQTCTGGVPSTIEPVVPPVTCEVNCQCVTITPDPLSLPGATTISYQITTVDDPYFASPLYIESPRSVNPILADESFTQCFLSAGNYLARVVLDEGLSTEVEMTACEFTIIELAIGVWAGWRTAADFAGLDPIADFSYAVVSGTLVQFTDTSYDLDGTVEAWLWQFRDENGTILATSTAQNPSYDFGSLATYMVTLTVQDDDLRTDSITETVSL